MPEGAGEASERLREAKVKLEEAERNLREGHFDIAVHVGYYAAFHAALGLLARHGSHPRTHKGVASELGRVLVATKRVDASLVAGFVKAMESRAKADYGVLLRAERIEAENAVDVARRFIAALASAVDG